jgi:hypothetical protein
MLAAACLNEFEDIFLLAGNGRGAGATKLLRAFYERTVTFSYLAQNPNKISQFIDYSDVHWHKLLTEAERIHTDFKVPDEDRARIKSNFERVQQQYRKEICKHCKTTEPQGSWTKRPILDMASQINDTLRSLAFNAYLRPTFYIHTTHFGILDQSEKSPEGKVSVTSVDRQREMARNGGKSP